MTRTHLFADKSSRIVGASSTNRSSFWALTSAALCATVAFSPLACSGGSLGECVGDNCSVAGLNCDDPCDCEKKVQPVPGTKSDTLFLLDRSDSMEFSFAQGSNGCTSFCRNDERWNTLKTGISAIKSDVEQLGIGTAAMTFPTPGAAEDTMCNITGKPQVQFEAGFDAIVSHLDTLGPAGFTPMASATSAALDYLRNIESEPPPLLVLGTDGIPQRCNQSIDDVAANLENARSKHGIHTVVIGIAIDDKSKEDLNKLAEAGGLARDGERSFHNADTPEALSKAIRRAVLQGSRCRLSLDEFPTNEDVFKVRIGNQSIKRNKKNGWNYVADNRTIQLNGPACDMVIDDPDVPVIVGTRPAYCGEVVLE